MTQDMFKIGDQNEREVNILLEYLVGFQFTGLCAYLADYFSIYEFLRDQEVFETETEQEYPVEHHILVHEGYSRVEVDRLLTEYKNQWDKSDPVTPYGQLRRWWCYNLAVAMSQGKC